MTSPRITPGDLALVVIGGSVGTSIRFALDSAIGDRAGFPLGIFLVNLSGAWLLGVLVGALDRTERSRPLRLFAGTGALGGYTTYSALALDSAVLIGDGRFVLALGYMTATIVLGLLLAVVGLRMVGTAE